METTAPEVPTATRDDAWLERYWRRLGGLVIALWLGILITVSLAGERQSDLGDLTTALAEGSTSHVEITGLPRDSTWTGSGHVSLRWQGRYVDRVMNIRVIRGAKSTSETFTAGDEGLEFRGDLVEWLRILDPDLTVSYVDHRSGAYWEGLGWRAPGWVGILVVAAFLSTLLLTSGPRTWRATRWAWVWLVLLGGWIGIAAFLLLGGPAGVGRPRDGHRRLTGGWAFLLALVLGGSMA